MAPGFLRRRKAPRPHAQTPPRPVPHGGGVAKPEGAAIVGYARQSPGSRRQHGVASRFNVRSARNHSGARKFIPEQSESLHLSRSAAN